MLIYVFVLFVVGSFRFCRFLYVYVGLGFMLICTNTTKTSKRTKDITSIAREHKQKQTADNNKTQAHKRYTPRPLTSIARPVMTLCKSRARNDVWDIGPGSYTTSYLGPPRGNVVFAGPYHRADTTEVLLKVFSTFREAVPKARHLPTEARGGGHHRAGM